MKQPYIQGINGLRAIGVLCVLIAHFWPRPNSMLDYFHFGRFGVVLFFVISGFLVVTSLQNLLMEIDTKNITRNSAIKKFYWNRALRIFPIYYLAIAIVYFFQATPDINNNIQWLLFYGTNYVNWTDINLHNTGHFWTLAVEEQFYLIIPFLLIFIPNRYFFRILVSAILLCLLFKLILALILAEHNSDYIFNRVSHPLLGCLEGLCAGALLATTTHKQRFIERWGSYKYLIMGCILVIISSIYRYYKMAVINTDVLYAIIAHIPFTILSLSFVSYVLLNQQGLIVKCLEYSIIKWIGIVSYGIYIFHDLAKPFISTWIISIDYLIPGSIKPYALFIIGSSLSIIVASLSFILFERPIMKFKSYGQSNAKIIDNHLVKDS